MSVERMCLVLACGFRLVLADVVGSASLMCSPMYGWELHVDMTERYKADCSHQNTVNGATGGSERVLCEDCGDVIVRDESMIPRDIDRSMFSRDADSADVNVGAHSKP